MKKSKEVQLAERIIQLDLLRDELYEQLLMTYGWRAQEFLRAVQNSQFLDHPPNKMKATEAHNEESKNEVYSI
ncbi:hypothetical protein [Mesobacillus maritimus]|uniref:Uncharacterized protein n=1 Tax=Mesobacillus maritimus TaxID=1643336 RepID=A0ABS7K9J8_9BACI|nr:hypothetical protein [Mesobacillus maritimus]MBY0098924.1 hypothetical protein [Mesobacillus maritimus]